MPFPNPSISDKRTRVTFKDKSGGPSTYRVLNVDRDLIRAWLVDGGILTGVQSKCDYLLINKQKANAYLIELKGSDLLKAVEQINSTLNQLAATLNTVSISGRIVLSKNNVPNYKMSEYKKLDDRLRRQHRGSLQRSTRVLIETI